MAPKKRDSSSCTIAVGCSGFLESDGRYKFYLGRVSPGPELARLELATPWSTTSFAVRVRDKYLEWWRFDVDWNAEIDPTTEEGRAQIAKPWVISSRTTGLVANWTPSGRDVASAGELIVKAQQRVIVGATPARVVSTGLTVDENGLVVGGTATVRIELENTGGSTAVGVTAKSRSSLPQLHNLSFSFGNLRPGKKASKAATVTLPANVTGDGATVVLTFSETNGHEPPDLTQKLPFKKAACPEGRFTRERYDTKRAKLQKALDDGSMTQAEFDTYDAELVRCLD